MSAMVENDIDARRKRARRTALVAGGVALAIFILSIVQMIKL